MSNEITESRDNSEIIVLEHTEDDSEEILEYVEEPELETCIVDSVDYEDEFIINDNSNASALTSNSEDAFISQESEESGELIVPEVRDSGNDDKHVNVVDVKPKNVPGHWPTLEILPGGVINRVERQDDVFSKLYDSEDANEPLDMYACAKCSKSFQHLFSLVKHVKDHEEKKGKTNNSNPLSVVPTGKKKNILLTVHSGKKKRRHNPKKVCK